jgi:DNA-directed RNA polymerase subunit RPC12/RpoP
MPTRTTAAYEAAGDAMEVRCPACLRCVVIPAQMIRESFPVPMAIDEAAAKFRCSHCGHKGATVTVGERPRTPPYTV